MFDRKATYACAYTSKEPSLDPEIARALDWLDERFAAERILVVTPTVESVRASAVLTARASELESVSADALRGGYRWAGGRALALWPIEGVLEELDRHPHVSALAVIPWRLSELGAWIRARQPLDLLRTGNREDEPRKA
jgi:hypothetical protein